MRSDLFAQIHQENGTCGEGQRRKDTEADIAGAGREIVSESGNARTGSCRNFEVRKPHRNAPSLQGGKDHREVSGILIQLSTAFLTLFLEHLDSRNDRAHQLEDDARADVRHNTQGEDGRFRERTTCEGVVQAEQVIRIFEVFCENRSIYSGDGDVRANAVNDQKTKRKKELFTQVFNLKSIDERIDGFLECFH